MWIFVSWNSEVTAQSLYTFLFFMKSSIYENLPLYVLNYPRKLTTSNTRKTGNTLIGKDCVTLKLTSWCSESRLFHTRSRLLQSAGRSCTPGLWSPDRSGTERLYWPITKRRPSLEMKRGVPKTGVVVYYKFQLWFIRSD